MTLRSVVPRGFAILSRPDSAPVAARTVSHGDADALRAGAASARQGEFGALLGCAKGRSSEQWVDFFGRQLVAHLARGAQRDGATNPVDGHAVPVRHFGVVLAWDDWHALAERLRAARVAFLIEPGIRFAGQPGEQATLFVRDPAGNALEFKAFRDPRQLFAR